MDTWTLVGGTVTDGSGAAPAPADLLVRDGRIAEVGAPGTVRREGTVLDVEGHVVAPGFIDMHAHSDLAVLADPAHLAKSLQGVTTEVVGQDGLGYAPVTDEVMDLMRAQIAGWNGDPALDYAWRSVADYLDRVDAGTAVNVATLVPHGTLRLTVMGSSSRPATAEELGRIRALVDQGMTDGAVGLSTGLTYVPGMYASDDELVDALGPVRDHGGFYCSHHRNYGSQIIEAYAECLALGERAGVPVHLAHCHVNFPQNRGRATEVLARIDAATDRGLDVSLDSYPYLAGATYLAALLPSWTAEQGRARTLELLRDATRRAEILHEVEVVGSDGHHGIAMDWSIIRISSVADPTLANVVGRTIADLAAERRRDAGEVFVDLLVSDELGTGCLVEVGNEENVRAVMRHHAHTVGSDGILVGERPHPRGWGSFTRFLGAYVRDAGLMSLGEGIAHMTSRPARRLGLADRGLLRPGFRADVVVLDPATVDSPATYDEPRLAPRGVRDVLVNGVQTVRDGVRTDAVPGRALRPGRA